MSDSLRPCGLLLTRLPLSMGFSRQEYWSGLSCPPPGDLSDPGIKPTHPASPALSGRFFTTSSTPGVPVIGEAVYMAGRVYRGTLYSPPSFAMKIKLL